MQKLCKYYAYYANYAKIMQKLCKKIMQNHAKNYAQFCKNYAKIMQCSRNALFCMHYAKIVRIMQKICKLCKSPKVVQAPHPPLADVKVKQRKQASLARRRAGAEGAETWPS